METMLVNSGFTARESRIFSKIDVFRTFEKHRVVLENCCLSEFPFIVLDRSSNACVTDVCTERIKEVTIHQNNVVQSDGMTILAALAVL